MAPSFAAHVFDISVPYNYTPFLPVFPLIYVNAATTPIDIFKLGTNFEPTTAAIFFLSVLLIPSLLLL